MFFHATTTTFETPCSWVFTKEDGSSGSSFAKLCGGSFRVGSGISPLLQVGGNFKQELKL